MAALLDVNALIALVDTRHVFHEVMGRWFLAHVQSGWATCPITENGMIRVLSQPAYCSGRRTVAEAIQGLKALRVAFSGTHQFWPDGLSLTDSAVLQPSLVGGSGQVTDVYLMALAISREGTLVSFDRTLAWQAVRGGSAGLVQLPE